MLASLRISLQTHCSALLCTRCPKIWRQFRQILTEFQNSVTTEQLRQNIHIHKFVEIE